MKHTPRVRAAGPNIGPPSVSGANDRPSANPQWQIGTANLHFLDPRASALIRVPSIRRGATRLTQFPVESSQDVVVDRQ